MKIAAPGSSPTWRAIVLVALTLVCLSVTSVLLYPSIPLSAAPNAAATVTPVSTLAAPVQTSVMRDANLRSGPGTGYAVLGVARSGQSITLQGCNEDCSWYQLTTGEWVAASLVQEPPAQSAPAPATPATPAATAATAARAPAATPTASGGQGGRATPTTAPTAAPTTAPTPFDLAAAADEIAADVGVVTDVQDNGSEQVVFVFPETHPSLPGQIEVAIMLNRLYEGYGLRYMGLEGTLKEDGAMLDATWFHYPPAFHALDPVQDREDVIVQLLENGEISSMEMMALVYEDVSVARIETKEEYKVNLTPDEETTPLMYLYLIAVQGLSQREIQQANDLMADDKVLEAIEFIIGTDEFTQSVYERLTGDGGVIQCEELVEIVGELAQAAEEVGAEVTAEQERNLKAVEAFYVACGKRSRTMVKSMLALMEQQLQQPVALTIGAAHTAEVSQLLADAGVSFAVIEPASLHGEEDRGMLSDEAYERKLAGLSVDPARGVGALLDERKKPPPTLDQPWLISKAELQLLTTLVARAYAGGQQPPFAEALADVLPRLQNVSLVEDSFEIVSGEKGAKDVIFSVTVRTGQAEPVQLWVRTRVDRELAGELLLEERLFDALANVFAKEPATEPEAGSDTESESEAEPELMRVSSDAIAVFATTRTDVETARLGG